MSQLVHTSSPFQPLYTMQFANIFQPTNNELWRKQERKAFFIIKLSVKYKVIPHILHAKGPKECWGDTLKRLYETKNVVKTLLVKNEFSNLWMDEGMSRIDFMRKITNLLNQFAKFDETLSLSFVVEQIFNLCLRANLWGWFLVRNNSQL